MLVRLSMEDLLLGVVGIHETKRLLHVLVLLLKKLFLVRVFIEGAVLNAKYVLEELALRVNPVETQHQAARRLSRVRVLELDPLLMLVLVHQHVHEDFTLSHDLAAFPVEDLEV